MDQDSNNTEQFLRRPEAGDQPAFTASRERCRARLHQMVCPRLDRRLQGRVDPWDVPQEACLHLAAPLGKFSRERHVRLRAAIDGSDTLDREIPVPRRFERPTYGESAQALGQSNMSGYNWCIRALGRLRDIPERVPGFLDHERGRPGWSIFCGCRRRGRDEWTG
jgi:DNA-directed RNA polymerase specialized sigma24 family protein